MPRSNICAALLPGTRQTPMAHFSPLPGKSWLDTLDALLARAAESNNGPDRTRAIHRGA
jgi:hypothetical protein